MDTISGLMVTLSRHIPTVLSYSSDKSVQSKLAPAQLDLYSITLTSFETGINRKLIMHGFLLQLRNVLD